VCTRERLVGFDKTKIGVSGSDEKAAEMKNQRLRKIGPRRARPPLRP
jgi:hypothetical protein